jgi:membrane glycosyltransferase
LLLVVCLALALQRDRRWCQGNPQNARLVAEPGIDRVLGLAAVLMLGDQQGFGGGVTLVRGALRETALALLQTPIRMLAHPLFVAVALTGLKLEFVTPAQAGGQERGPSGATGRRNARPGPGFPPSRTGVRNKFGRLDSVVVAPQER